MFKAYKFRVELQDVEPKVWRTFIIPAETTFKRLHDTLQFAMGWQDAHMYEFRQEFSFAKIEIVCDEEIYEEHVWRFENYRERLAMGEELHEFDLRWLERARKIQMQKAWTFKLPRYFANVGDTIEYCYDFGDNWCHSVTLEAIIDDYPVGYPQLLEAEGLCPPEDVGGSRGYEQFILAWNDPTHEEHEAMRTWGEGHFEENFDSSQVNYLMADLLKLKKVKK